MKTKGEENRMDNIVGLFCRLRSHISIEHKTDLNARYSYDGKFQVPNPLPGS